MTQATVTQLRPKGPRSKAAERQRRAELIARKARAMDTQETLSELRRFHSEYSQARNAHLVALSHPAEYTPGQAFDVSREFARADFRLRFALGCELHGPRWHQARRDGWITQDIEVIRAVGIVG